MAIRFAVTRQDNIVTDAEIVRYRRDGFVLPKTCLSEDDTAMLQEAVERVLHDNPDWHNLLRMPHIPARDGQDEGVIGGEELFKIALHPTLISVARRLVGPNVIMWGGEIFAKPPSIGKATPWHQDNYTPNVKPGPERSSAASAMIWIAVDNVDKENGCLRFIPGSGRSGTLGHSSHQDAGKMLNFEVDTKQIDESQAVDAELKSGHFSVHDPYVVHGANANTSGRRRAGLTFHYMAAEDIYDRSFGVAYGSGRNKAAQVGRRPIWLVSGENRHPDNDFAVGHQSLEDLDAYAEDVRLEINRQHASRVTA